MQDQCFTHWTIIPVIFFFYETGDNRDTVWENQDNIQDLLSRFNNSVSEPEQFKAHPYASLSVNKKLKFGARETLE